MPRQPGTERSQTIMIPFNSPESPPVEDQERPEITRGRWSQEVSRWRDVDIRRLEALLSDESIGQQGELGGPARDPIAPLIQGLLDAPDTGDSMRRLFEALFGSQR